MKRATIVEKLWRGNINKLSKPSEQLWKELRPGELEEIQMEEVKNMRRQERLASQRLNEREVRR